MLHRTEVEKTYTEISVMWIQVSITAVTESVNYLNSVLSPSSP